MRLKLSGLFVLLFLIQAFAYSQYFDNYIEDESILYAHTKQVNQFFRRFNGEEDRYGERLPVNDSRFQKPEFRQNYISLLFDQYNPNINPQLKDIFIAECTANGEQQLLDFHGGEWYAEVKTKFRYKGREKELILILKLQEEKIGSKWVISNVVFEPFLGQFINVDELPEEDRKFIHPLSHELDFMNLIKIFTSQAVIEQFAERDYKPDYLTLFIYEFRNSNLQFETVSDVKFHFFQIDGWYFELSKFTRTTENSGWLISNLLKISEEDKDTLKGLIFRE